MHEEIAVGDVWILSSASDYFEKKRFTSKVQRFKDHESPNSRLKAVSLDLLSLQTVSSSHGLHSKRGKSSSSNVIKINLDKAKPLHKRYEDIELPMSPCKIPSKLQLSDIPERSHNTCGHANHTYTHPTSTAFFPAANKPGYTSAKQSSQLLSLPLRPHTFPQTLNVPVSKDVTKDNVIQHSYNRNLQFHQGKENSSPQDLKKPDVTADTSYMPYSQPAPKNVFTSAFEWRKRQCDLSADSAAYCYNSTGPPEKKATLEENLGKINTHNVPLKREQCSGWESSPGSRSSCCSSDYDSENDNYIPELVQCNYNEKDNLKNSHKYEENGCANDFKNAASVSQLIAVTSPNVMPHNLNSGAHSTVGKSDHLPVLYCSETLSDVSDSQMSTQSAANLDHKIKRSFHKATVKSKNSENNLRNLPIQCQSLWMKTVNASHDTPDELAEKSSDVTISSCSDTKSPQHKKWMDFINQPVVYQDTIGCCKSEGFSQVRSNGIDNPTTSTSGKYINETIPNASSHNDEDFYKTENTKPKGTSEQYPDCNEVEKNSLVKSNKYLIQHKLEEIESSLKDGNVEETFCKDAEMRVAEEAMKEVMSLDMQMNDDICYEEDMLSQLSNISQLTGGCNSTMTQNGKDMRSMINPTIEMLSFSSDDQGKAPMWKNQASMKGAADTIPNQPSKSMAKSNSTRHQSDTKIISKQLRKGDGTQEITGFDQSVNTIIDSEAEKNKPKETREKEDIPSQGNLPESCSETKSASKPTIEDSSVNTAETNSIQMNGNYARKSSTNPVDILKANNDGDSLDNSKKTSGITNVNVNNSSSLNKFVDTPMKCTPEKHCELLIKTNTGCMLESNKEGSRELMTEIRNNSATNEKQDSYNSEDYQQRLNNDRMDACNKTTSGPGNCNLLAIPLQQSKGEQIDTVSVTIHEVQTETTNVQSISVQCDQSIFHVTKTQDAGIQCNMKEELQIKSTEHKATQTLQDNEDNNLLDVSSPHVDNEMQVESTENSTSFEVKYNLRTRKPT
uniref:Dentin sialophosphoprotein-like n=1 Tax=Saccoglossus kowalevskii TaxID=10224 RepID=A0ABM0MLU1_SACKO|nr:PREDICTED: dentin sialophosphoprotein-like [Saccoglossus kowalevskii]